MNPVVYELYLRSVITKYYDGVNLCSYKNVLMNTSRVRYYSAVWKLKFQWNHFIFKLKAAL